MLVLWCIPIACCNCSEVQSQADCVLGRQDYDEVLRLEPTCCQALVRKGKVLLALKKEEVRPHCL